MYNNSLLHRILLIFFSAAVLTAASSCTVKQELVVHVDESGNASFEIAIEDYFIEVVKDFQVFAEEDTDVTQDNLDELAVDLNTSEYTSDAIFNKVSDNFYTGSFNFSDLEEFFNELREEEEKNETISVFTYEKRGFVQNLNIYIDIENYYQLKKLVPLLEDPEFAMFGPEENIGVSEEDYIDMISFALGDEGPPSLLRSFIEVVIITDHPIISQKGGRLRAPNEIVFNIPMLDFLLLAEPIRKTVTW
ncbi:MAG: hypothetical protein K9L21_01260 [Spirochaetia bacterium]|nr:hypothetical protein [Spirochaetia bacterium]